MLVQSWMDRELNALPLHLRQLSNSIISSSNSSILSKLSTGKLQILSSISKDSTSISLPKHRLFLDSSIRKRKNLLKKLPSKTPSHIKVSCRFNALENLLFRKKKALKELVLFDKSSPMNFESLKRHSKDYLKFKEYQDFKRSFKTKQSDLENKSHQQSFNYYKSVASLNLRRIDSEKANCKLGSNTNSVKSRAYSTVIRSAFMPQPNKKKHEEIVKHMNKFRNRRLEVPKKEESGLRGLKPRLHQLYTPKFNGLNSFLDKRHSMSFDKQVIDRNMEKRLASYEHLLNSNQIKSKQAIKLSKRIGESYLSSIRSKLEELKNIVN